MARIEDKTTFISYRGKDAGYVLRQGDRDGSWTQGTVSVHGYIVQESPKPSRKLDGGITIVTNPKRWYLFGRRSVFPKIGTARKISEAEKSIGSTIKNVAIIQATRRPKRTA